MRLVGARVPRVEDRRILTGRGHYVDDVVLARMVHVAFVRSPLAHARIVSIDVSAARDAPGVVAVFTGEDVRRRTQPLVSPMAFGQPIPNVYGLAIDKVRMVGDLVAMVVGESRCSAEDAAELVEVEYDALPVVIDAASALAPDAPAVFEELGGNLLHEESTSVGDVDAVFAAADHVVSATLRQHRVANVPMETRGAVADFDPSTGDLTYHVSTQSPHGVRMGLAQTLGHPMERLRVLTADVGGGFGLKIGVFREDVCVALASVELGRPVKWIEDRNEHLLGSGHAREETISAQVAVRADGTLLGLQASLVMDQGSYQSGLVGAPAFVGLIGMLLPGPYRLGAYRYDATVVTTNKCAYVSYRGPWEIETWARERLLDIVATELGLDPAIVRRRNLVDGAAGDRLITGLGLEGITSRESLDRALETIGYDDFGREQQAARADDRYLGIGFATFIEAAPGPPEMRHGGGYLGGDQARVKLEPDGHLVVTTTQTPHGQGHETTLAQVAAEEMGIPFEHVRVVYGDTSRTPFSLLGTGGSRASTWASGAVISTTRRLKAKVLALAAAQMEIDIADLDIVDGLVTPLGVPERAVPLAQLAMQATLAPTKAPPGVDTRLEDEDRFLGDGITGSGWSGGTHACIVEVDIGTGAVVITRYVVAEDCGRIINPGIVEGQIRGGVAQGIGGVLYEHAAYDDDGNFLAGTFADYLLPTAMEIPRIEIEHIESDPDGPIGFRGVGEGGAIVAPACVTNAIENALSPFGAKIREQYLPPNRVLELAGIVAPD
jgi:carbon-monoxide dehydrogenase large subunit